VPFTVRLRHPDGRARWQPVLALAGLDNLYGPRNPQGMVIVHYGDHHLQGLIKLEAPATP
jgi:hypothetical protein